MTKSLNKINDEFAREKFGMNFRQISRKVDYYYWNFIPLYGDFVLNRIVKIYNERDPKNADRRNRYLAARLMLKYLIPLDIFALVYFLTK